MACASAVTVREPARLLAALAWGAPCVSAPDAAAQVGAVAGTQLLVGQACVPQLIGLLGHIGA